MHVHLVGIGGAAMGNLAAMFKEKGFKVTGSDQNLYPPMSDRLREWKIPARPFSAKHLGNPDLCVIGNAMSRGNEEVEAILNQGLAYTSMSGALAEFFLKGREVIVVAGTHGKTTTTFLIDHIIGTAGKAPGLFVGGIRGDGHPGYRVSKSKYFVIEGDEYDTAFFDKASKFLRYLPRYLALTSVEFDHADIFSGRADYELTFRRLLRLIPGRGLIAACADDAGARRVLDGYDLAPVIWYGKGRFEDEQETGSTRGMQLFGRRGRSVQLGFLGQVDDFALLGRHNTANALAAALLCRRIGIKDKDIRAALQTFPGVLRRQQIRAEIQSGPAGAPITVIEDFAHHPTAVRETIHAVKEAYPGRKIHAFFEPRSATSHRSVFQTRYVSAFARADHVYLPDVFNKNKVPANARLDVRKLTRDIAERKGKSAVVQFSKNPEDLMLAFRKKFRPAPTGDVILLMSNGAFGGIYEPMDEFVLGLAP